MSTLIGAIVQINVIFHLLFSFVCFTKWGNICESINANLFAECSSLGEPILSWCRFSTICAPVYFFVCVPCWWNYFKSVKCPRKIDNSKQPPPRLAMSEKVERGGIHYWPSATSRHPPEHEYSNRKSFYFSFLPVTSFLEFFSLYWLSGNSIVHEKDMNFPKFKWMPL